MIGDTSGQTQEEHAMEHLENIDLLVGPQTPKTMCNS